MGYNYVKDKNKITSIIKNKDINRALIGECKINLIDDEGEIIKEGFTENLISNDMIYNLIASQINLQAEIPSRTETINYNGFTLNKINSGNCFNQIMMTNTDIEEDARNPYVSGAIAGYADLDKSIDSLAENEGTGLYNTSFQDGIAQYKYGFSAAKANNKPFNQVWLKNAPELQDEVYKEGLQVVFKPIIGVTNGINASGLTTYYKNKIAVLTDNNVSFHSPYYTSETREFNVGELGINITLPFPAGLDTSRNSGFSCLDSTDNFYVINTNYVYQFTIDFVNKTAIYIKNTKLAFKDSTSGYSIVSTTTKDGFICGSSGLNSFYETLKKFYLYNDNLELTSILKLPENIKINMVNGITTTEDGRYLIVFGGNFRAGSGTVYYTLIIDLDTSVKTYT